MRGNERAVGQEAQAETTKPDWWLMISVLLVAISVAGFAYILWRSYLGLG